MLERQLSDRWYSEGWAYQQIEAEEARALHTRSATYQPALF